MRPPRLMWTWAGVLPWRCRTARHRYLSSSSKVEPDHAIVPLPSPRSLSPSTGLLLFSLPVPPALWPSHLDLYSGLYRQSAKRLKGELGLAVNCIYDGHSTATSFPVDSAAAAPADQNVAADENERGGGEEEAYPAILYRGDGNCVEYSSISISDLDRVKVDFNHTLAVRSSTAPSSSPVVEILVCTHGSRDCRCSDRGMPLVNALRRQIKLRGLDGRIVVGEIAHVGGHKYAANAIVLPTLDMYSNILDPEHDAVRMIDHLLHTSPLLSSEPPASTTADHEPRPTNMSDYSRPSEFWAHWRGRYGSSEAEQHAIWHRINPDLDTAPTSADPVHKPNAPSTTPTPATAAVTSVRLTFRTFEGDKRVVLAHRGEHLLDVARREDLPSMEGTCGGNLECSTCHLYIDASAPIPEAQDEEVDMLDYALGYREGESRLGCQIRVDDKLAKWCEAGGELRLPRY